jgi:predicted  nucleic acid-binding Zn-ribbon protein
MDGEEKTIEQLKAELKESKAELTAANANLEYWRNAYFDYDNKVQSLLTAIRSTCDLIKKA